MFSSNICTIPEQHFIIASLNKQLCVENRDVTDSTCYIKKAIIFSKNNEGIHIIEIRNSLGLQSI
jgi:hypothetical protein